MSKLKIGDRVRRIKYDGDRIALGQEATVVGLAEDCDGLLLDGFGDFTFCKDWFELVAPASAEKAFAQEPRPGDRVVLRHKNGDRDTLHGKVATFLLTNYDGAFLIVRLEGTLNDYSLNREYWTLEPAPLGESVRAINSDEGGSKTPSTPIKLSVDPRDAEIARLKSELERANASMRAANGITIKDALCSLAYANANIAEQVAQLRGIGRDLATKDRELAKLKQEIREKVWQRERR